MSSPDLESIELAPCGYALSDRTGLILAANVELLTMLGLSSEQVVGKRTLHSLVSMGGRIYFESHLYPILNLRGVVSEVALDLVHVNGSRVPALLNANVSQSAGGGIEIIRAVFFRAQDRRRYEADLLDAVRSAEEARRVASELAHTLQQTLIPPTPPQIPGLEVAAAYRPAGDGTEVGGDFFDFFQVGEHEWVIVLGDVMGKGAEAAAVTAFVRHTIRALAARVVDPAEMLAQLDAELVAHPTQRFCTMVVVRTTQTPTGTTMVGSVGGHPLPLLRKPDGTVVMLGQPGSLVGTDMPTTYGTFRHELTDELVVLYTDGVTEARRGREQFSEKRLTDLVDQTDHDVHLQVQTIVEAVLDYQEGVAVDDIAVVALGAVPEPKVDIAGS